MTHDGNTVNFEDLSTASAAENWVEGSTLTLLTDADVSSSVTVPAGEHTLDLNGHGIRATGNQNFSVITIPADAELTLNDSGSTTHKYSVESSLATVDDSLEGEDIPTFTGGYITGGRGNNGGAVFNSGVFTMNAGTIIGNKVNSRGGGIYNSGTVNLTGGQIIYNVAQQWGAGIYLTDTAANTLNLSGGSITNNLCNNNGGGIQVSINAKVNVSGDPVVKDNYSTNGLKNNINLSDNGIINVTGQLDSAALIGVRRYDGAGVITAGENTDYNTVANFSSDNADYVVGKDMTSGQLKLHAPYTVTWKNYNDDVLETDTDLREGDIPTYDGVTPTKPDDKASFYIFDKWSPDVTAASSDAAYTASFTKYDAVAKVGDTLYLTFPDAVNAAEGAVIILLADIPVADPDTAERNGDVYGDGLNITDATWLQRYLASVEIPYEIGKIVNKNI